MVTEDYVDIELARLLKEKGFRAVTNRYYNAQYEQIRTVSDTFMMDWNDEEHMRSITMPGAVAIPTIQMVLKWLREEHNIFIGINPRLSTSDYSYITAYIYRMKEENSFYHDDKVITYSSYGQCDASSFEKAYTRAIEWCVKNLID